MTTTDPQVTRDLTRLIESEALGASMFATAARLTREPSRQRGWELLHELEVRTDAGVTAFLRRHELTPPAALSTGLAGAAGSVGAHGLRWAPYAVQLDTVRLGTRRYLPAFRRLAEHFRGTDEAAFFDYVVRHELAIIDFTTTALTGARGALDPVQRLLDGDVPGIARHG